MNLVEDLPRPQHQSSQSIAQAAALLSQLSDVVARRRDRTHHADAQTPALPDPARRGDAPARGPAVTPGPDTVRAATPQQSDGKAANEAAGQAVTPATTPSAVKDANSADLADADTQTTHVADVIAEARQAGTMASTAFPAPTTGCAPKAAAIRTATPIPHHQVTRSR